MDRYGPLGLVLDCPTTVPWSTLNGGRTGRLNPRDSAVTAEVRQLLQRSRETHGHASEARECALHVLKGRARRLQREPSDPPDRRALVELVVLAVEPDDLERVDEPDVGQLCRCRFDECDIPGLKGASKAGVGRTAASVTSRELSAPFGAFGANADYTPTVGRHG